jgi:hypothetical protein
MIGDAALITDAQLLMLARAFALNNFHGAALSPHEDELIADLAERFLAMGARTTISSLELELLTLVLEALEAASANCAVREPQVVERISA